jgi:ATP-dependent helicase/nuclease subunit B
MNVQSIPAWYSFTDALAQSLLHGPSEDLSQTLILLPNRRACRALKEALTKYNPNHAMILPRMMPFADLDPEDAVLSPQWVSGDVLPPISVSSRQGILMQLIIKYGQAIGESGYGQASHAVQLASELARLIDQIHWEGLPFTDLANIVPEDYAQHWQITIDFLKIITDYWPAIMQAREVSDPAAWRRDLILGYADKWRMEPPAYPVIAAGSTGSIPCTAELMKVVASLPQGRVILPGLDHIMPDDEWQQLEITHPQYGMGNLLKIIGMARGQVAVLETDSTKGSKARFEVLSRAMQPSVGGSWLTSHETASAAGKDFRLLECTTSSQEAGIIGLIMRQALEQPEQTVALVTPDRQLAARVHRELERWDLKADDTAGCGLRDAPEANFMLLLAESLLEPDNILSLLNVLHHPLVACGERADQILEFDRTDCRQYRTVGDMCTHSDDFNSFYQPLAHAMAAFKTLTQQPLSSLKDLIAAHFEAAQYLAGDRLWACENSKALADFWSNINQAAEDFPDISAKDYPSLLQQMMSSVTVREPYGYHPRLFILGPLEARTIKTDVMILGGLNEGTWPSLTEADPWLNRPMRADYGLPLPERRIGLSAHDFAQAFCAKTVICTRSLRVNGAPTVASRWLLRLETVLRASGIQLNKSPEPWASWYMQLDQPNQIKPHRRPAPRPPLAARPRQLSVTQIETWMRDPYALYARQILKLRELDPLEKPITVAEKGTLIHNILDTFVTSKAQDLPSLLALGQEIFASYGEQPEVINFWWPRFERIAAWFIDNEEARKADLHASHTEISGKLTIATTAGPFSITAKADRLDVRHDGSVDVIDYKTGGVPSWQNVEQGLAPQLTLEAAILNAGGFKDIGARPVNSVQYWRLQGSNPAGEIRAMDLRDNKLQTEAIAGLKQLVESYGHEHVPYLAQPRPKHALRYNPYAHLTRTQEWIREDEL